MLADERRFLTPEELAREVKAIGRLHAGLTGIGKLSERTTRQF